MTSSYDHVRVVDVGEPHRVSFAGGGPPVLEVRGLSATYPGWDAPVLAVRAVDLAVGRGETLCVVGESGCGKSSLLKSILRLESSAVRMDIEADYAVLDEVDLESISKSQWRGIRGGSVGIVFQDAMSTLNPLLTIGEQVTDAIRAHKKKMKRAWYTSRAVDLLESVGISDPAARLKSFPHEFSGGMLQRVVIAIAIANGPAVMLADEPTTALDVTLQAQILGLLRDVQRRNNMGLIMVTHDLGVVAEIADRVAVMYAGRIVETGSVRDVLLNPRHPYTIGLIRALPSSNQGREDRLRPILGQPPSLSQDLKGCSFADRCALARGRCLDSRPQLVPSELHHSVACHFTSEIGSGQGIAAR